MKTKKLTRDNFNATRDHLFDCLHRGGHRVKLEFPNTLRWVIEHEMWKEFTDLKGKPFTNLVDWLHYMWPNGTGMGENDYTLTYEDALKLTEKAQDVHRILLKHAPKNEGGRPTKNGSNDSEENCGRTTTVLRRHGKNATRTVLSIRLMQEKPAFYEAYLSGKYKSIWAAAIAAGLRTADDNLGRTKSFYRKMTPSQRREFLKWVKDGFA